MFSDFFEEEFLEILDPVPSHCLNRSGILTKVSVFYLDEDSMRTSIRQILIKHRAASLLGKRVGAGAGISQLDMVVTQFGFVGTALLFPTHIGLSKQVKESCNLLQFDICPVLKITRLSFPPPFLALTPYALPCHTESFPALPPPHFPTLFLPRSFTTSFPARPSSVPLHFPSLSHPLPNFPASPLPHYSLPTSFPPS